MNREIIETCIEQATQSQDIFHKCMVRLEMELSKPGGTPLPRPLIYAMRALRSANDAARMEFRYVFKDGPEPWPNMDPTGQTQFEVETTKFHNKLI